jgi:hypothetical protein
MAETSYCFFHPLRFPANSVHPDGLSEKDCRGVSALKTIIKKGPYLKPLPGASGGHQVDFENEVR